MREFIILKHNYNSALRYGLIVLTLILSLLLGPSVQLEFPVLLIPTGVVILGSVIHHIHYENYKEVAEFYFHEEGISILNYEPKTERLIPISELRRVLIQYQGYYGQERLGMDVQTNTDFGDNNYIQIETSSERIRIRFFGNNAGDAKHINKWSEYFSSHGIVMKSANYLAAFRFLRRFFDKPLS